ncbi:PX domain-containing protein ypt35 [Onygenales sp. PD_12]|nr:PX domain-containing protein ypt35 [Emmonsiellopsis sp. PD_33]KAK2793689.1 PX domain-containing protein ypt35 [Onygenales sp. PD_12]
MQQPRSLPFSLFARTTTRDLAPDPGSATPNHNDRPITAPRPSTAHSSELAQSPTVIPPYWRHYRNASQASQTSLESTPRRSLIRLEDHTEDPTDETNKGLWARSVTIDDYIIVKGRSGIGAYVVWICRIQTLDGGPMVIRMRYSEFDDLRAKLRAAFPYAKSALPQLPPKSAIFKFSTKFLEARRVGLAYFLNCVLLNPEFAGSAVLKEVLFSHVG